MFLQEEQCKNASLHEVAGSFLCKNNEVEIPLPENDQIKWLQIILVDSDNYGYS